jgi:hypothetical protein
VILLVLQWYQIFQDNFQVLVASKNAHDVDTLGKLGSLFERLRFNLRQMEAATPGIVGPEKGGWGNLSALNRLILPSTHSTFSGTATTPNMSRQDRLNVIVCSEIAHIDPSLQEEVAVGTASSCDSRIFETTPCGPDNWYAQSVMPMVNDPRYEVDMYGRTSFPWNHEIDGNEDARQGPLLIVLHWTMHPDRVRGAYYLDEHNQKVPIPEAEAYPMFRSGTFVRSPWFDSEVERRAREEKTSKRAIEQELNLSFLGSGSAVFAPKDVQHGMDIAVPPQRTVRVLTETWPEQVIEDTADADIHIFKEPQDGHMYAMFADCAECLDDESDLQAFGVVDTTNYELACAGTARWATHEYAKVLCVLGYYYNEALLGVEANAIGSAVLAMIARRTGFTTEEEFKSYAETGGMWYQRLFIDWELNREQTDVTTRLGVYTSWKVKRKFVSGLDRLIADHQIYIPDRRFWTQARQFMNLSNGRMGSQVGYDDLVMAIAGTYFLAPFALSYKPVPLIQQKENKFERFRSLLLDEPATDDTQKELCSLIRMKLHGSY